MKIKYNVKGVDSGGGPRVKPGAYVAKVKEFEVTESKGDTTAGEQMLVVTFEVVKDADGSKSEFKGQTVKSWILTDYEPTAFKWRQFLEAVGKVEGKKGETGELDTDKLVGTEVQIQVRSDKDRDGEYMPKIGRIMSLDSAGEEPEEPEEESEEEEPEEPEEEEPEEPEEDEDTVDLDQLDRAELKKLIKDEGLEIKVFKTTSDDDIRAKIAEALGEASEEEEPEEPEEEPEEDDGPDLDSMDRAALKAFIKENDLKDKAGVKVFQKDSDDDIREKIKTALGGSGSADEAPDYDSWDANQVKAELKERGIELEGRFSIAKGRKALKDDDASDSDPF